MLVALVKVDIVMMMMMIVECGEDEELLKENRFATMNEYGGRTTFTT
jgi:hypothetical protein